MGLALYDGSPLSPTKGRGSPEPAHCLQMWLFNDREGERQDAANCLLMRCSTVARDSTRHQSRSQRDALLHEFSMSSCDLLWFKMPFTREEHHHLRLMKSIHTAQQLASIQLKRNGSVFIDITSSVQLDSLNEICQLDSHWDALLKDSGLHVHHVHKCNLGVVHEQNGRPLRGSAQVLTSVKLPDMSTCQCGRPRDEHCSNGGRSITRHRRDVMMQVLLLLMIIGTSKASTLDTAHVSRTLSGIWPHSSPAVRRHLAAFTPREAQGQRPIGPERIPRANPEPHWKPEDAPKAMHSATAGTQTMTERASGSGHHTPLPPIPETESFPTESRMRQKEKHRLEEAATGEKHVVKKKPVVVEPGADDCGSDGTSIELADTGHDVLLHESWTLHSLCELAPYADDVSEELEALLVHVEADLSPQHWLFGSDTEDMSPFTSARRYESFVHFMTDCFISRESVHKNPGLDHVDVFEMCGGTARVSTLLIRRRHVTVGLNFDAVVGIDLLDPRQIQAYWAYIHQSEPICCVLSPPCTGLKGWSSLNRVINPEAWHRSQANSVPLGQLAGQTALFMLQHGRHFVSENPQGSELYQLPAWDAVRRHPRTVWTYCDQCAAGLRDMQSGLLIRKRTEIWASDEMLIKDIRPLQCNGRHQHAVLEGTFHGVNKTHLARVWPWEFAARIASGVAYAVRQYKERHQQFHMQQSGSGVRTEETQFRSAFAGVQTAEPQARSAFPGELNEFPPPGERDRNNRRHWPCPACRNNVSQYDARHTRHPEDCRYPLVEHRAYSCPGCQRRKDRAHGDHTYIPGECRFGDHDTRHTGRARQGHHPRDGRRAASAEPTSSMAPDPAADIEVEVPVAEALPRSEEPPDEEAVEVERSGGSGPSGTRAPPRERRTWRSVEAQAGTGPEWSSFDLGRALQLLRSYNEAVVRRTLRTLHIRWFHASAEKMAKLLAAAGAPGDTVKLVHDIVDTCRVCRAYKRPGPANATTARLTTQFNDVVQHDLLFIEARPREAAASISRSEEAQPRNVQTGGASASTAVLASQERNNFSEEPQARRMYPSVATGTGGDTTAKGPAKTGVIKEPWQHMLDTCTRLTQAKIVESKTTAALLEGISEMWIRPYGPPKVIESDQEGGLITEEAKRFLGMMGIELKEKGVNAHARMVEKHHDILRQMYLRVRAQADEEGLNYTAQQLLTITVTAKNSLTTIGGFSPLQAVLGYQPGILPDLDRTDALQDDSEGGVTRHMYRLREIAVQSMVETTAKERAQRALRSRTRPAIQTTDWKVGDTVEFFRTPSHKEASGWRGPATIVLIEEDGTTHVKWQGGTLICRMQDIRPTLIYHAMVELHAFNTSVIETPYNTVLAYIKQMTQGTQAYFGYLERQGRYVLSDAARKHYKLFLCLLHIASCGLHLAGCLGVRLSFGTHRLSGMSCFESSIVWHWLRTKPEDVRYLRIPGTHEIVCSQLNPDYAHLCILQFMLASLTDTEDVRVQHPDVPHLGGPYMPDVEGVDPAVRRIVPPQPAVLPDSPATSIETQSRRISSASSTDTPSLGSAQPTPTGTKRQVSTTSSQQSGNPAPHKAATAEPAPAAAEPAPAPMDGTEVPTSDWEQEGLWALEPLDEHNDDAAFLQDSPPGMPSAYMLDAVQLGQFAWSAGAQPSPPEGCTVAGTPPFRDSPYSSTQQCRERDSVSADLAALTEHCYITAFDEDEEVELYVALPLAHWHTMCKRSLQEREYLVFKVSQQRVSAVIKREFDNLSAEEIVKHATEVNQAKLDELRRWFDLKCFRRMKRALATNKVDGTWVLKWKKVRKDINGTPTWVRIIKARLTARGFKDMQAYTDQVKTYSGTATKWAQRAINAHAAQTGYTLFSMDISAAFLKGLTFEEIAKETGDPLRKVQFDFPQKDAWLLRKLPGMEDYDNTVEILDLIKAMWGLKDAPRAFGMRLCRTLRESGYEQGITDPQIWRKFKAIADRAPGSGKTRQEEAAETVRASGSGFMPSCPPKVHDPDGTASVGLLLLCIISTHIDDIKGSGTKKERETLLAALRKDYGNDAKIEEGTFEHTGIKHEQDPQTGQVYTHQNHYVKELSEVVVSHLDMSDPEAHVDERTHESYWSLLGALAWLLMTRADIAPFIGYLQRAAQKPQNKHIRMINKVLRYCKRVGTGILFRRLQPPVKLVVVADAAYQSNETNTECTALRGYIILLVGSQKTNSHFPGGVCQLLDFVSKKFNTVTRSSFAAELRNQLEAAHAGVYYNSFIEENCRPGLSACSLAMLQDNGHHHVPCYVVGDNDGVFKAVSAENPRTASEPILTPHIRAYREMLDRHLIKQTIWCDNRDMIADPLTKGKTQRNLLNHVLNHGEWIVQHATRAWPPMIESSASAAISTSTQALVFVTLCQEKSTCPSLSPPSPSSTIMGRNDRKIGDRRYESWDDSRNQKSGGSEWWSKSEEPQARTSEREDWTWDAAETWDASQRGRSMTPKPCQHQDHRLTENNKKNRNASSEDWHIIDKDSRDRSESEISTANSADGNWHGWKDHNNYSKGSGSWETTDNSWSQGDWSSDRAPQSGRAPGSGQAKKGAKRHSGSAPERASGSGTRPKLEEIPEHDHTFDGASGSARSTVFPEGQHKCEICEKGYAFASYLAYFKDKELKDFYCMTALALTYQRAAAEKEATFENLYQQDKVALTYACFACHGRLQHDDNDYWVKHLETGRAKIKTMWTRLARHSRCVPSETETDRQFQFALKNAREHVAREEQKEEKDDQKLADARQALQHLRRGMEVNGAILSAAVDWVTKVGPGELHIHCLYGIPTPNWENVLKTEGNRDNLVKFLDKYDSIQQKEVVDRSTVPDHQMNEHLSERLKDFGFWPHSHASWYLCATQTRLVNAKAKKEAYDIQSSSGSNQAWFDCLSMTRYMAGVHDAYRVITFPKWTNGEGASGPAEFDFFFIGKINAEQNNKLNLLKTLNLTKMIRTTNGDVCVTKEMVLQAIAALAAEATSTFKHCKETVYLKTADPKVNEQFDPNSYGEWTVVCHDERLSMGQHGHYVQGFLLNRNDLKNMTMNNQRMEDILMLIGSFCCFDEMAIDKANLAKEDYAAKYPGTKDWGPSLWKLFWNTSAEVKTYAAEQKDFLLMIYNGKAAPQEYANACDQATQSPVSLESIIMEEKECDPEHAWGR